METGLKSFYFLLVEHINLLLIRFNPILIFNPILFLFTGKENFINNQELPKLMIVSFILLTLAFDSRLIL